MTKAHPEMTPCSVCDGSGLIRVKRNPGPRPPLVECEPCPKCGSGYKSEGQLLAWTPPRGAGVRSRK